MTQQIETPKQIDQLNLADLLAARTTIDLSVDAIDGSVWKRLSPLPISTMQAVFADLIAQGCIATSNSTGGCDCGSKGLIDVLYAPPHSLNGRFFEICLQCWNVWETFVEYKTDEAVDPLMEESITWTVGPVPCETSDQKMTASNLNTSVSTLYAKGDE